MALHIDYHTRLSLEAKSLTIHWLSIYRIKILTINLKVKAIMYNQLIEKAHTPESRLTEHIDVHLLKQNNARACMFFLVFNQIASFWCRISLFFNFIRHYLL